MEGLSQSPSRAPPAPGDMLWLSVAGANEEKQHVKEIKRLCWFSFVLFGAF